MPTGAHPLELALVHVGNSRRVVLVRGDLDRLYRRLCAPVIGINLVGDQVLIEMAEHIGSGAYRVLVIGELRWITADTTPDVFSYDEDLVTKMEERRAIRGSQREGDGTVIGCSPALD